MKLLRILLIVVGCVIGVVALCLVGMIIFSQYSHKSVTGNDGVAAGYTQTAPTGGPLEQRYRQTGSYPIDHYTTTNRGLVLTIFTTSSWIDRSRCLWW